MKAIQRSPWRSGTSRYWPGKRTGLCEASAVTADVADLEPAQAGGNQADDLDVRGNRRRVPGGGGAHGQLLRAAIVEAQHRDRVPVIVEGEHHGHGRAPSATLLVGCTPHIPKLIANPLHKGKKFLLIRQGSSSRRPGRPAIVPAASVWIEPMDSGSRLLIYSHDSFGLGHLRRCRAIAHHLVERFKGLSVLILSGSPIIGSFDFRSRVDFVRVPGVIKLRNGAYTSLNLHLDIENTLEIRRSIIHHTAEVFAPDLFLVDKEPLGLRGEVRSTLEMLRARGTRCVLGLRDVMDEPASLVDEWQRKMVFPALERLYHQIWVYGLPELFDPLARDPRHGAAGREGAVHGLSQAHRAGGVGPAAGAPGPTRGLHSGHPGRRRRRGRADRLGDQRLRARPRPAPSRRPADGAVHAGRAETGLPGAGRARLPAGRDHLRGAGSRRSSSAPARSSPWAATTRSARSYPSASRPCWCRGPHPGSSSICAPSGRSGWGWSACCPTTAPARQQ